MTSIRYQAVHITLIPSGRSPFGQQAYAVLFWLACYAFNIKSSMF
jgi:hypothetical protein